MTSLRAAEPIPRGTPRNNDAERAVLGACLKHPRLLLTTDLDPADFYFEPHRLLWEHMQTVSAVGELTLVTLGESVLAAGLMDVVGGPVYVADLLDDCVTTVGYDAHVAIVADAAARRRLISACTDGAAMGYDPDLDLEGYEAGVSKLMAEAMTRARQDEMVTPEQVIPELLETLRVAHESGGYGGLETGFIELDQMTMGLHKTDLIILAARPGMGKTSLALNVTRNVAAAGRNVAFFSLEMSREQLVARLIASEVSVNLRAFRGAPTNDELRKICHGAGAVSGLPIRIDDGCGRTVHQMSVACRRLSMREELDLVVIDYLQLVAARDKRLAREAQVSEMSRDLKVLAKELRVPIVCLAQLNRALESRSNKRPILSDLRESGAIEANADAVLFLYRDEVYNPGSEDKGIAEVIVGKQRSGPVGTARLAWVGQYTRFANLTARVDF